MSTCLEKAIKDMLRGLGPPPIPDWPPSIYKVPNRLRKINDAAYTPQVISIGPLHHGKEHLRKMEMLKLQYVSYFLQRDRPSLLQIVITLKKWERRIRCCYAAERLELDTDKFLKIILIDAIFIIEYFCKYSVPSSCHDYVLSIPRLEEAIIWLDLILLENQLPFFLLEELYELAFPRNSSNEYKSFLALALTFFSSHNKQAKPITMFHNIKHFTDLIRLLYLPFVPNISQNNVRPIPTEGKHCFCPRWFKEPEEISKTDNVPSAIELDQAGVILKMKIGHCRFDINYTQGVLEIPRLELFDDAELIFRNMMALEQCHYPSEEWIICDYVVLLDHLINTNKDVDLLVQKGIICHGLSSSEAVAEMINKLSLNTLLGHGYYSAVQEGLIRYCKVPWHKWKKTFKHDYFRTPWRTASSIAAVIFLVLTFIQTICSILSVSKP